MLFLLPMGQIPEEAQEACNKNLKNIQENYIRKCFRIKTHGDLLHTWTNSRLIRSLIAHRFLFQKIAFLKMSSFLTEVLQLLTALKSTYYLVENNLGDES